MKLLLPACGSSSRYPNLPPKWSLLAPTGYPMIYESIRGIKVAPSDIIIGVLRQHEDALGVTEGIRKMFGTEVQVLVFDQPTHSQSETVFQMLTQAKVQEPFLIKDTDNMFFVDEIIESKTNYICVESLNNFEEINPPNKSYVKVDENDLITSIKEKVVISDLFCVGGYYFTDPEAFCQAYQKLVDQFVKATKELYISDIIGFMLLEGMAFNPKKVHTYMDWGTIKEWHKFNRLYKIYLVNLDGVVFEYGSPFFHPTYAEVKPNMKVVKELLHLELEGNKIIFVSEREETWRSETETAITELGFKSFKLVMGCSNSQHILVNACSPLSPYPSARAINLFGEESSKQITSLLQGKLGV